MSHLVIMSNVKYYGALDARPLSFHHLVRELRNEATYRHGHNFTDMQGATCKHLAIKDNEQEFSMHLYRSQ